MPAGLHPADSVNHFLPDLGIPRDSVRSGVALANADAPELNAKCPAERELARAAKAHLEALAAGAPVDLFDIGADKYGRRVVASIALADGRDLGEALIAKGLARPYSGGSRPGWCTQ